MVEEEEVAVAEGPADAGVVLGVVYFMHQWANRTSNAVVGQDNKVKAGTQERHARQGDKGGNALVAERHTCASKGSLGTGSVEHIHSWLNRSTFVKQTEQSQSE